MISMIVKGTRHDAMRAARERSIPAVFIDTNNAGTETALHVSESHMERGARWYVEDWGRAPYPPGTILRYSVI